LETPTRWEFSAGGGRAGWPGSARSATRVQLGDLGSGSPPVVGNHSCSGAGGAASGVRGWYPGPGMLGLREAYHSPVVGSLGRECRECEEGSTGQGGALAAVGCRRPRVLTNTVVVGQVEQPVVGRPGWGCGDCGKRAGKAGNPERCRAGMSSSSLSSSTWRPVAADPRAQPCPDRAVLVLGQRWIRVQNLGKSVEDADYADYEGRTGRTEPAGGHT
jgi:hypothetical protein